MSKTQWILMFSPIEHMISKCKTLMVDMFEEQAQIVHAKANLELLCDMLSVVSKMDGLEQWKM